MPIRLVTPPTQEPLTLEAAKSHLRLDSTLDDDYVTTLITVARRQIEGWCWRGIMKQTLEVSLAGFRGYDRLEITPEWRAPVPGFFTNNWLGADTTYRFQPFLDLPRGHLNYATPAVSIVYLDQNGNQQTLPSSYYLIQNLSNDNRIGRVFLNQAQGYDWPNTLMQFDAVKITYTVGWDTPAQVPAELIHAMKIQISDLYEHRTPVDLSTRWAALPMTAVDVLIDPYRFVRT